MKFHIAACADGFYELIPKTSVDRVTGCKFDHPEDEIVHVYTFDTELQTEKESNGE